MPGSTNQEELISLFSLSKTGRVLLPFFRRWSAKPVFSRAEWGWTVLFC